jgi:hypothetical protein
MVGHLASLFLGQQVRPLVLLDGDDAGRVRQSALMKELYAGYEQAVLILPNVLGKTDCELEDLIGESAVIPAVSDVLGTTFTLTDADRQSALLVDQIKSAAARLNVSLPDGWKSDRKLRDV